MAVDRTGENNSKPSLGLAARRGWRPSTPHIALALGSPGSVVANQPGHTSPLTSPCAGVRDLLQSPSTHARIVADELTFYGGGMLDWPVPSVPAASGGSIGIAWLRANVVRFSEGRSHECRRALVETELKHVDIDALRDARVRDADASPVAILAAAMGLPASVEADVAIVAAAYQPHAPISGGADGAVARLVTICGRVADERTANRIGILVQAHAATTTLIAGVNPPVPFTRRLAPSGEIVEVDLEGRPFGEGRHACPGRAHALALGASAFHRLHYTDRPLVLPNAWDFASAAMLVRAGFPAIGTTSLGVAAAYGLPDAAGVTLAETLALARRLVRLPVPITVDVESGFGADPSALAAELWDIGVAGVNVEDAAQDPARHARIVRGLKDGAPGLFVNARIDTHWLSVEHDTTVARALRYLDAGADGIFVPGMNDDGDIETVVQAVPLPVNILASRDIDTLARLGVRRISTGSLLFRAALEATVHAAEAVRDGRPVNVALSYETVLEATGSDEARRDR
jgi:2-methylisocitrate lyase-like PEP mutase family enzyme